MQWYSCRCLRRRPRHAWSEIACMMWKRPFVAAVLAAIVSNIAAALAGTTGTVSGSVRIDRREARRRGTCNGRQSVAELHGHHG